MDTTDDYRHVMDIVEEVERRPASKVSADMRCFARLIRLAHNEWRDASKRVEGDNSDVVTPHDLYNYLMRLMAFLEDLAGGDCSYPSECQRGRCVRRQAGRALWG